MCIYMQKLFCICNYNNYFGSLPTESPSNLTVVGMSYFTCKKGMETKEKE